MNKTKLKNTAKIIFSSAFISLMLAIIPAYAFDGATLSEIKISSKDNYSYKVTLKATKDVPVQKYITSDNKIVIDLNNTRAAEFVNTIYNNTPEIDNVIVQAVSNDKVRIFIQGLNIASSKIILDSRNESLDLAEENSSSTSAYANNIVKPEAVATASQAQASSSEVPVINLGENSPSNTSTPEAVKPQASENNFDLYQDAPVEKVNENNFDTVKSSMLGNASLKKIFSKEGFDWILRIFAVIFIFVGAIKLFSKPKNVTIDLSSDNLRNREMELYKAANERKELLARSLGSNYTKEKMVKNPAYGANSQYGLKEYQNSQLPPQRLNRPSESLNSGLNKAAKLNSALKTTRTPLETRKPVMNSNSRINQKDVKTAKRNVDNIQFLENMAAIYQKSGRTDLAQNIRQKISRTAG